MKDRIFSIRKSEQAGILQETLQRHGSKKRTGGKGVRKKSVDGQLALFKD